MRTIRLVANIELFRKFVQIVIHLENFVVRIRWLNVPSTTDEHGYGFLIRSFEGLLLHTSPLSNALIDRTDGSR